MCFRMLRPKLSNSWFSRIKLNWGTLIRDENFVTEAEVYCAGVERRLSGILARKRGYGKQTRINAANDLHITENHSFLFCRNLDPS